MLMYFQTVIFMQKSLFGDTYWKAWPLGLFFSMHRTRWSKGIFEGSQPWNTRLSMPELKQNKAQCMPYFGVSYLPLAYAGLHSHPRLCPHLRRHQVQSEDGQSCFLGPVAPAVSRGRLSLLIWLLNPSQLLMRCLTNILGWTNVQICRLLIWTRASACSKSFRAMAGNWLPKVMKFGEQSGNGFQSGRLDILSDHWMDGGCGYVQHLAFLWFLFSA